MITQTKAGMFKTPHPGNLGILSSSGLLSTLLASTEPKGFKSTAKNPTWVAAMDEEIRALQQIDTWTLVLHPANTNIVGSKWVFRINICLMDPSSISRLVLLQNVILRFLVLTTLTLSVQLSKLPLSVLCFLLQSQINDLFDNLMSRMLFLMELLLNVFIWNNLLSILILNFPFMFVY